jgi:hypothetical protein
MTPIHINVYILSSKSVLVSGLIKFLNELNSRTCSVLLTTDILTAYFMKHFLNPFLSND